MREKGIRTYLVKPSLIRIALGAEEEHVLREMRQPLQVLGVIGRPTPVCEKGWMHEVRACSTLRH